MFEGIINLLSKKKGTDRLVYPLPSEIIKRDKLIEGLTKSNVSKDAQLSNIQAKEKLVKDRGKEFDDEQETIKELLEKKEEMHEEDYGNAFSFGQFYTKLLLGEKKDYNKLPKHEKYVADILDRDMNIIFAKFGDFNVLRNGEIALIDSKGSLILSGEKLNQVLYKPGSIGNQLKRKMIRLPCDEKHRFFPDIEEVRMPECTYNDKTGKIKWAEVSEKPVKQLIIDREQRIAEDSQYIERLEKTKAEVVRTNKKLARENNILKNSNKNIEAELSENVNARKQFENKIGTLQNKLTHLRKMKTLNDGMKEKLMVMNEELMEKIEDLGVKNQFERVLGRVQEMIDWTSSKLPQKVPIEELGNNDKEKIQESFSPKMKTKQK